MLRDTEFGGFFTSTIHLAVRLLNVFTDITVFPAFKACISPVFESMLKTLGSIEE